MPDPVELARNRFRSPDDYARFQLFHSAHLARHLSRFVRLEGLRILDAGCGNRGFGTYLATLGNTVFWMDSEAFGSTMLRDAAAFAAGQGVAPRFFAGDIQGLSVRDGSFDLVVLNSVVEHVPDPDAVLAEMFRVLAPGGLAFVDFPLYYSPYGHHMAEFFPVPWQPVLFAARVPGWLAQRVADPVRREQALIGFRSLSRLTIRRYLASVRKAGFEIVHFRKNWYFTEEGQKLLSAVKRAFVERTPSLIPGAIGTFCREISPRNLLRFLFFVAIFPFQWLPFVDELTCPGVSTMLRRPAAPVPGST
ncbi:MAG: class I SAM-dependent methyltransferase [Candidatus Riflebacteria bacterium]|nr:class I SAM-dependent methyltransferase [Candidatus Riflebacteria bacterium]